MTTPRPGQVLYADSLFDGCSTPGDVADALEEAAQWLRGLEHDGWTFEEPEILDGYATLVDPDGRVACAECCENLVPARGVGECDECTTPAAVRR